jgi:predicted RecA/RadA family phage recombinase
MRNFVQAASVVTLICAQGGRSSGDVVKVGAIVGVAAHDAIAGAEIETKLDGAFYLEKVTAQAWATVGLPIYYDAVADKVTTVGSGNTLIGVNLKTAANPSTQGLVRLNGAFVVEPHT